MYILAVLSSGTQQATCLFAKLKRVTGMGAKAVGLVGRIDTEAGKSSCLSIGHGAGRDRWSRALSAEA